MDMDKSEKYQKILFDDVWLDPVDLTPEGRVFTPCGCSFVDALTGLALKMGHHSVVDWAKIMGVEPVQLHETMRTLTDKTATEWVNTITIRLISYYLSHTTWSPKMIAGSTGFPSANAMGKFYLFHAGIHLMAYREKHQRIVTKTQVSKEIIVK
jgi:hypothetical protein